jgi:prolyl-tRNA editing enzyme YbaK/EbsC (Cys-tRNA(Pro) deacylase)
MSQKHEQSEATVKKMAKSLGIKYEFIPHQQAGHTTADAESALQESPDHILKTLIFVNQKTGESVGVILRGDQRLDTQALKKFTGFKNLRFASTDEIKATTGFPKGGVPPMAVQNCDVSVISTDVLTMDYVIGAGGHAHCGIKLVPSELKKIPNIKETLLSE